MTRHYDVVVAGSGPGGASAAIALARAGVPTLIVDRRSDGDRIGESLPPSVGPLLDCLGVREAFEATKPTPCYGNRSVWGGAAAENDFIRHPLGHGWHIDRRRFDAMLLEQARAAGADYAETRVARIDGRWQLTLEDGSGVNARVLVDATGRSSAIARRLGARRRHVDRLMAIVAFLETGSDPPRDSMTLIEAIEDGWWYTAVLPDGRIAASLMTDPDLRTDWNASLARTSETKTRVRNYCLVAPPRTVGAGSSRLDRVAGEGWIAVGDAAATYDPLSSHGIGAALAGGLDAAAAIQSGNFETYTERIMRSYAIYLRMWVAYYAEEMRWPRATFWQRRHFDRTIEVRGSREEVRGRALLPLNSNLGPRTSKLVRHHATFLCLSNHILPK